MSRPPASGTRIGVAVALLAVAGAIPAVAGEQAPLPCPGCILVPNDAPGEIAPAGDALLAFDWSLGLRGGIVRDLDGTHYQAIALPSLSASQQTLRGGYSFEGSAELSASQGGSYRLDSASLNARADYAVDEATTATLSGSLGTSQDAPDAAGLPDSVAEAPVVSSAEATASLTRQLGAFAATIRAGLARSVHGETVYGDGSRLDNSDQNTTDLSGGGRLTVPFGPVVAAFGDAEVTSETYAVASSALTVTLDNRTYQGKLGLSAKWSDTFSLEAGVGLARRDFLDASLNDVTALVYNASARFQPNETLSLTAALSSELAAPDADCGCTADVTREASVAASYLVNPWLRLRGSLSANQSGPAGGTASTSKWQAGVGADYLFNAQTDFTADYGFSRTTTGTDPTEDTQTLMAGVTVHR